MKLKNSSITEFINEIYNKKLYCFGAGSIPLEMCDEYPIFNQKKLIYKFIDNNKELHGKCKTIGSNSIPIISIDDFILECDDNSILLFTLYNFSDIFFYLDKIKKLENLITYSFRMIRATEYDKELRNVKLPSDSLMSFGNMRIPKVIHYCWFGNNEMSDLQKKCIESWKKFCPDYKIVCWNEDNYDITKNSYMYSAYNDKKWAYVSDYARIDIVYRYGGVYLDTDVELIRNLDTLLYEKAFCGFESKTEVNFGLGYGAEKHNSAIKKILDLYELLKWDGGKTPCPVYQTSVLKEIGLKPENSFQRLDEIIVLPTECLASKSIMTRKIKLTPNTFAIHHFLASWCDFSKDETEYRLLLERAEQQ